MASENFMWMQWAMRLADAQVPGRGRLGASALTIADGVSPPSARFLALQARQTYFMVRCSRTIILAGT